MNIQEVESKNWNTLQKLSDYERSSLLCYLFGYFKNDEGFQNAAAKWIMQYQATVRP